MQVRVGLHGWYRTGVDGADGLLEVTVPVGSDVLAVAESLREQAPMLDGRASLVMIDGRKVELDLVLEEGQEVHYYPIFSGG